MRIGTILILLINDTNNTVYHSVYSQIIVTYILFLLF